jgi:hypothetical protein
MAMAIVTWTSAKIPTTIFGTVVDGLLITLSSPTQFGLEMKFPLGTATQLTWAMALMEQQLASLEYYPSSR